MIDVEMIVKGQNKVALEKMMNKGNALIVRRVFALTAEAPSCTESDWLQEQFETLLAGALAEAMEASYRNTLGTVVGYMEELRDDGAQEVSKHERS